jgi:hypothetical protein
VARVVGRQEAGRVDIQREQIADCVRVFGAVQPVQTRSREVWLGIPIDLALQEGHELVACLAVERRATIRGRHQSRTKLADDLFPGLGIGRHGIEGMRLQVQPGDLLGRVMAVEANRVDDGRLALAVIADEAAAGRKRACQRGSYE